jgi:hypothetical protein
LYFGLYDLLSETWQAQWRNASIGLLQSSLIIWWEVGSFDSLLIFDVCICYAGQNSNLEKKQVTLAEMAWEEIVTSVRDIPKNLCKI